MAAFESKADIAFCGANVRKWRWSQPVNATPDLILSGGIWIPRSCAHCQGPRSARFLCHSEASKKLSRFRHILHQVRGCCVDRL